MKKVLSKKFFDRPTLAVARDLLGKFIVHRISSGGTEKILSLMITEVEAYDGPRDRASHASRGLTPRTKIMFGDAGYFYVYFTYGMHWLVNVVTGPRNYPAAVLLRAGEYRTKHGVPVKVIGPARLTKYLKITGAQNGKLSLRKTGLWIEDRGVKIPRLKIVSGKRIGVDYAGPIWAGKLYNFKIK